MTKVLSPQALKCPQTGKSAYASEARAMAIVKRSQTVGFTEQRHSVPAREAYICQHCGWWHLTKGRTRR